MGENIINQLDDYFSKYLEYLELQKYSGKTAQTYKYNFRNFKQFIASKSVDSVQDVDLELLEQYRYELVKSGLQISTVHAYIYFVQRFFHYLEREGILFINPAENLENPPGKSKMQYVPSWETMKKLLARPDVSRPEGIRDRALLETCVSCALRRDELLKLDVFDVDLKNRTLRIKGKGNRERKLPLTKQAVFWLAEYLDGHRTKLLGKKIDRHALWISVKNNRMGYNTLNFLLGGYCRQANIKTVSTHQIRRLAATEMLRNGASPLMIQHLLGHSTMQTLSSYLKITITDLKKTHQKSSVGK